MNQHDSSTCKLASSNCSQLRR